jgi:two-component system, cell cycle response regulator
MASMTDSEDKKKKDDLPSFAMESANELSKLRKSESPTTGLFGPIDEEMLQVSAKTRILFLRGDSAPSSLIEESLIRHQFDVTSIKTVDEALSTLDEEPFEILLMDHAFEADERSDLLRQIRDCCPELPVLMVLALLSEDEELGLNAVPNSDILVRDTDGAYLLRIPDRIEQLLVRRKTTQKAESPMEKPSKGDEVTEEVDLQEVANGLLGIISESQKASLTVLAGPDLGKVTHLGDTTFVIGRDSTCQLQLKDDSISRYHARIYRDKDGQLYIEDLDSTNGTFISGNRIKKQVLNEGDTILLGEDTFLKYQIQDSIDKNYYDEIYYSSTRDALTGIYNRKYCVEKIKTDLSYARRHLLPVSLMMFDVDHFKKVNDTYGHPTGDAVLTAIAEVSFKTLRTEDILGRYGGEEFLVFAMDTSHLGAQILAERLRDNIERRQIMALDGSRRLLNVTVSIGIATTDLKTCYEFDKMMSHADANLYKAKENGRNRVIATEMFE